MANANVKPVFLRRLSTDEYDPVPYAIADEKVVAKRQSCCRRLIATRGRWLASSSKVGISLRLVCLHSMQSGEVLRFEH